MGIRGLQSVMENGDCPGGTKNVRVRALVDEYRSLYGDRVPTIVVDGCSCINRLYGDLCWVMGGQWKEYRRVLEDFVEKFRKIGVELIFFFDGPTMPDKRATWVNRRLQKMEKTKEVFAAIHSGRTPNRDHFHIPCGMATFTRMTLKYICKCEVIMSRSECDLEIAAFAKKNNSLAILAQDSDYVIFDTVPYLSISNLNLSVMTTLQYDRRAFAGWLWLRINQLPLFASLCGNDLISFDSLQDFRRYVISNNSTYMRNSDRFLATAEFIRLRWKMGTNPDLSAMAKIVFGDDRKAGLLKKSIDSYHFNWREKVEPPEISDVINLVTSKHVKCENLGSMILGVLNFAVCDSTNVLEEHKAISGYKSASLLYRSVRQRCYYIIQTANDVDSKADYIDEWCAYPGNSLTEAEKVKLMPCCLPPGGNTLRDLWFSPPDCTGIHLEAFLTCFGVAFDYEVDCVPQKYFIFCCVVNFLSRNTKIKEWEIDALIAQAIILNSTSVEFLERIAVVEYVASAVYLATLFTYGVNTAWATLSTCSYPLDVTLAMPWNFYDGKLFHRCYVRAMSSKSPNYTDGNMKPMDGNLFGAVKRMCLSKKTLV